MPVGSTGICGRGVMLLGFVWAHQALAQSPQTSSPVSETPAVVVKPKPSAPVAKQIEPIVAPVDRVWSVRGTAKAGTAAAGAAAGATATAARVANTRDVTTIAARRVAARAAAAQRTGAIGAPPSALGAARASCRPGQTFSLRTNMCVARDKRAVVIEPKVATNVAVAKAALRNIGARAAPKRR